MLEAIQALDSALLLQIQDGARTAFLSALLVPVSRAGDMGLFWIALCVLLLLFRRTRRGGALALCGLAAEFVVCDLALKRIVLRPRPYLVIQGLVCLVPPENSASFPSGHAASSFVCACLLACSFGKKGVLAYAPALLIALSRVYVGVHYPSDVLAGMVLGTLVGVTVWAAADRFQRKRSGK